MLAVTCSVVIRPRVASPTKPLGIADIRLYGPSGARLPAWQLALQLSSTSSSSESRHVAAGRCSDDDTGTVCETLTPGASDPMPQLKVMYTCAGGATSLSSVEVISRRDCCQQDLLQYRMDFLNISGLQDRASYLFQQVQDKHTTRPDAPGDYMHHLVFLLRELCYSLPTL